jgi:hypothetical protein
VLDSSPAAERRPRPRPASSGRARRGRADAAAPRQFSGPYVTAGPYEREDGGRYEVRLERVPGGVRMAEWAGGHIERRAPELAAADLPPLIVQAVEQELLADRDLAALSDALTAAPDPGSSGAAASAGSSGDLREELRVERIDGDRLRIGRWLFYPSRGWELQDAPPMLPAQRYAEALRGAAAGGLFVQGS